MPRLTEAITVKQRIRGIKSEITVFRILVCRFAEAGYFVSGSGTASLVGSRWSLAGFPQAND